MYNSSIFYVFLRFDTIKHSILNKNYHRSNFGFSCKDFDWLLAYLANLKEFVRKNMLLFSHADAQVCLIVQLLTQSSMLRILCIFLLIMLYILTHHSF